MSILQSDKAILDKGRTNKLKEAKAGLRDQIVRKLYDRLEEDNVGVKLGQAWHSASAQMSSILDRQQVFLKDLDSFQPADAESPFGGISNLHLPMPFIVCKTYHARFLEALLGIDPPFTVKPRREDVTDRIGVIEDLMRYSLLQWANKYRGIEETLDTWVWNWCTAGTGIMKARWLTEYETFLDVQAVPEPAPPIFSVDENGFEVAIPQVTYTEREVEQTLKTFSGPQYDFIQMEDFRMLGGSGDPDLADYVFHRTLVTASELWLRVDEGKFDEESVEKIIRSGPSNEEGVAYTNIKSQRAGDAGKASISNEADLDRYEIIEACFRYDVVGNGITSEIVAWWHPQTSLILGATYLRRIMPSGERPYSVIHFHKRPGEEWGMGLLEILHPLSKELDAMHNIRIDNGIFSSMPFFFYRASSSLDPENIYFEPGQGIPLDNPQTDVVFPQMGNKTSFTAGEEGALQTYVERLTGISDLSLGVMSGQQGATRTASGVRALLGENNNNLNIHLRRLNRGWTKLLKLTWHMLKHRVEPGFTFRVTGDDGQDIFHRTTDHDTAMDVDFEVGANTANSNKSVRIEMAQQAMALSMNPLNLQLGICGPDEVYAAQKLYLNELGFKDVHRFIKRPTGYEHALSPMDEFNRVVRGQQVNVSPASDHDGFIAFAQVMLEKQSEAATLSNDQINAIISQLKAHEQMKAAMDQQAAQAAVATQMQANAAMSQNQAPAGLNPMAGSGGLPTTQV